MTIIVGSLIVVRVCARGNIREIDDNMPKGKREKKGGKKGGSSRPPGSTVGKSLFVVFL